MSEFEFDRNACRDYNTVARRARRARKNQQLQFWGGMNRRQFMGRSAAAVGAAAMASSLPAWFPECTFAGNGGPANHTFIFIHLFGGPDGLAMISPYGDDDWFNLEARQQLLSVPLPGSPDPLALVDLDGFNGMSGALAKGTNQAGGLKNIWDAGQLCLAMGCTLPLQSYSHFSAEFWVGQATPNPGAGVIGESMLARYLESTAGTGPIRGMSVASNLHDHLLGGLPFQALPISNAENFGVDGLPGGVTESDWVNTLVNMYGNQSIATEWQDLAVVTQDAINLLDMVPNWNPAGYGFDNSYVGRALRRIGVMLNEGVSLETVTVRPGGWDTHNNQGSNSLTGGMWLLMESLALNIHEFWRYMTTECPDKQWTIYMTGEFGREADPEFNDGMGGQVTPDTAGTDHGYGTNIFMIGPRICGGQVANLGLWPGLGSLHSAYFCGGSNDVCANTDSRIYLVEIMDRLMGVSHQDLSFLFPEYNVPSPAEYHGVVC